MKVVINAVSIAPGGGLAVLLGYLRAWRSMGTVVNFDVYASRAEVLRQIGDLETNINLIPFACGQKPWRHYLAQSSRLGKMIDSSIADVVWSNQIAVPNCNTPQIIHHQNLLRFMYKNSLKWFFRGMPEEIIRDRLARKSMRKSECNVFISQYIKDRAEECVPCDNNKNHVIYNGIDDNIIGNIGRCHDGWSGGPCILAIQSPSFYKGNETLLLSIKALCTQRPEEKWRLDIIGGGKWMRIKALAASLGISRNVCFHGFLERSAIDIMLQKALCLIFPSKIEGFGNPVIEAMSNKCPVVASNTTAIPEIVGKAGLLIEPGNAEEFANAILSLLDEPERRRNIIKSGMKRIQSFNWNSSAQKMLSLFECTAR